MGDANLPSKHKLVFPNLVAYCTYHVHFCLEHKKYVFILLKSQSRISPLKTPPSLEMEVVKVGVSGSRDIFNMLAVPSHRIMFTGDSMVVSAFTSKYFHHPQAIEYRFLKKLREIRNMGFPLLNYLQVPREQVSIVDILTKARLCNLENLPQFIGKFCPEKHIFDLKCAFWEGPSQTDFCELVWRLGGREQKSQLGSSFSTHKLLSPQISQNDSKNNENSQNPETIEEILNSLKIEVDDNFLPENFPNDPQNDQNMGGLTQQNVGGLTPQNMDEELSFLNSHISNELKNQKNPRVGIHTPSEGGKPFISTLI